LSGHYSDEDLEILSFRGLENSNEFSLWITQKVFNKNTKNSLWINPKVPIKKFENSFPERKKTSVKDEIDNFR